MSDVDAIRQMASEHDLEFVDLDTYGVDPTAGEILPASLARQHHVVAVKRKFGTPVIATADPDDLTAQDSVRTSIGRDFISVVAAPDQIGDYLDQLFGSDAGEAAPEGGSEAFEAADEIDIEVESESVDASVLVDTDGREGVDPFDELLVDELEEVSGIVEEAESAIADDAGIEGDQSDEPGGGVDEAAANEEGATGRSALEISPVTFEAEWHEIPTEEQVNGSGAESGVEPEVDQYPVTEQVAAEPEPELPIDPGDHRPR